MILDSHTEWEQLKMHHLERLRRAGELQELERQLQQTRERERTIQEAVFKPRREFADGKPLTLAQKNQDQVLKWLKDFQAAGHVELTMTVIFESNETQVWDKLKRVIGFTQVAGDVWELALQGHRYRTKVQVDLGKASLSEFEHVEKSLDVLTTKKLYIFTPDSAIKTVCLEKRTIDLKQT